MNKAGFALVVNGSNEVLMVQCRDGKRAGKWGLPGGETKRGERRREVAVRHNISKKTGIIMDPRFFFYDNRHNAHVWLGTPLGPTLPKLSNGRWFTVDQLPDVDDLAYAIDVSDDRQVVGRQQ